MVGRTASAETGLGGEVSFLGFFTILLLFCCPFAILILLVDMQYVKSLELSAKPHALGCNDSELAQFFQRPIQGLSLLCKTEPDRVLIESIGIKS